MRIVAVLTLACIATEALAASRPRVPPGTWAVEYAKEYCVLSREGVGDEPGIAFRTRPLTDEHDLLLFVQRTGKRNSSSNGKLLVGESYTGPQRWVFAEEAAQRRFKLIQANISSDELIKISAARTLRLVNNEAIDFSLSLPAMDRPLAALRLCEEDLARRWGVDPAEMRNWSKPAKALGDLRSLFWNDKDWARSAIIQSGATRAVLDIDETGTMVGCKIVQRSRVAWVDRQFCDTIRQGAKFQPALDANGKSVKGQVVTPPITSVRLR